MSNLKPAQALVFPQVAFRLIVRKEDLSTLCLAELDMLRKGISTMILSDITIEGYTVQLQMTLDGVTTSINA